MSLLWSFHYVTVKGDVSTDDISKTQQLTSDQSVWINIYHVTATFLTRCAKIGKHETGSIQSKSMWQHWATGS